MGDVENMGFLRRKEFIRTAKISPSAWDNGVSCGRLPPKFQLSKKNVGYLKSDIRILLKYIKLYKLPRKGQLWVDIKKMMLERHPD